MIKAVIVDDELLSLKKLEKLLWGSGLAEVSGAFTKPLEALEFLKENKADAVFLDIEMPDMDGIELASRILDIWGHVDIVFVTAYNQYAVEAFQLNALDYLLKPVTAERLDKALARITAGESCPILPEGLSARCFGKFTVTAKGGEIRFRTEKAEELLAFLIDHRGAYVSRNKILDVLWEDFDGDRAVIHFNTTLHNVKKALLRYGVTISILYDRGNYRLDTGRLACDYLDFCAFAENAGMAGAENILKFEETAALYTGEYLSGWEFHWASGKRVRLEEQFIGLLLNMARYYIDAGDCRKAAKWLEEGLPHAPLHRELNYRLIEALQLANEQMLAVKYFELYKNGLVKKLGLAPDPAFKILLQRP